LSSHSRAAPVSSVPSIRGPLAPTCRVLTALALPVLASPAPTALALPVLASPAPTALALPVLASPAPTALALPVRVPPAPTALALPVPVPPVPLVRVPPARALRAPPLYVASPAVRSPPQSCEQDSGTSEDLRRRPLAGQENEPPA